MTFFFQIADSTIGIKSDLEVPFYEHYGKFYIGKNLKCNTNLGYRIRLYQDIPLKREFGRPDMAESVICKQKNYVWKIYCWFFRGKSYDIFCRLNMHNMWDHTLFLPSERAADFLAYGGWMNYIGLEYIFVFRQNVFLHSSVVNWHGIGVVFTAGSGVGKSTQAGLWERYEGARILNGDRTLICRKEDGYYGYGSPFAGSSGIYCPDSVKISCIAVLSQAKENSMIRMKRGEAVAKLMGQCIQNLQDTDYTMRLLELVQQIVERIPVYHLACRPDEGAVRLVKEKIAENENHLWEKQKTGEFYEKKK